MDPLTVYTNPFHNCRGVTLSAMLLRLGVPIDYVWHQAGLFYQENAQDLPKIDPYYQDIIENDHGVKWAIEEYEDMDTYIKRVYDVLTWGHTLALPVDIHELPHSMYYGHRHQSHTIEAVTKEDGHIIIADHPYHYFGPIETDALKKALDSYVIHIHQGPYSLLYGEALKVPQTYTRDDLLQAITDNCAVMEGARLYDLSHTPPGTKIGMAAFPAIISTVEEVMQSDIVNVEKELNNLFNSLKEVANSRHLLHIYLKLFQEETLANELHETSQNWIVATHMLLRGQALGDLPAMLPRVMKRLLRAQEKEQQNLQNMRDFLFSHSLVQG